MFRAHRQETDWINKAASGVSLDVLAAVVCRRDTSWVCVNVGIRLPTYIHAVHSARVPSAHYRSQHIQANTRRGFIYSVCLLTMGMIMPETCWAKSE